MPFELNSIFIVGIIAQTLFSARFIVQLFLSEKAKASVSPTLFWQISLLACYVMTTYAILREDLPLLLGQFISYFVYIRNIHLKGAWIKLPQAIRILSLSAPVIAIAYASFHYTEIITLLFQNPSIPTNLMLLGIIGQVIFSSRFVVQWIYSERKKESIFPTTFWVVTIIGATTNIIYCIFRRDLATLIGQAFSLFVASRNLYLRLNEDKIKE